MVVDTGKGGKGEGDTGGYLPKGVGRVKERGLGLVKVSEMPLFSVEPSGAWEFSSLCITYAQNPTLIAGTCPSYRWKY